MSNTNLIFESWSLCRHCQFEHWCVYICERTLYEYNMCVWLFFLVIPIPRSTDYLLMDTQSFMIRWSFRCFSYKQDSMHWSYTGLHACTYSMFASTSQHHCVTEGESTLYHQNMSLQFVSRSKSSIGSMFAVAKITIFEIFYSVWKIKTKIFQINPLEHHATKTLRARLRKWMLMWI